MGNGPTTSIAFGLAITLVLTCAVVAAYDVYAVFALPPNSTVSFQLSEWSQRFPVIPLLLGLLIGHLFWPISHPAIIRKE